MLLGGVRVVALFISFHEENQYNRVRVSCFYYALGMVLLGGVRVVALSISSNEQTR